MLHYHNITAEDIKNGDGLRTVLWLAGCEHHCPGCQNPVTWDKNGGIPFDEAAKKELLDSLEPDYISGITFSGGDPLAFFNREGVAQLIACLKGMNAKMASKSIWIYTGYTWEQLMEQMKATGATESNALRYILTHTDVLVDGRYEQQNRDVTLKWRGSSNQSVIDVPASLKTGTVVLHCD